MKKTYIAPSAETLRFETADVITVSYTGTNQALDGTQKGIPTVDLTGVE